MPDTELHRGRSLVRGGTLDDAASEDTSSEVLSSTYGEGAHGADPGVPPGFIALGRDNPWLVCRSPQHNGKLFWMHRTTHETTWRQPLPRVEPVPRLAALHPGMRDSCFAVIDSVFFGAPADKLDPKARTGICGPHQQRCSCDGRADSCTGASVVSQVMPLAPLNGSRPRQGLPRQLARGPLTLCSWMLPGRPVTP